MPLSTLAQRANTIGQADRLGGFLLGVSGLLASIALKISLKLVSGLKLVVFLRFRGVGPFSSIKARQLVLDLTQRIGIEGRDARSLINSVKKQLPARFY